MISCSKSTCLTLLTPPPFCGLIPGNNCRKFPRLFVCLFVFFRYVPVLMAQAKIYWNRDNYGMVEKIFRKSVEFCNEHDTWKLNVAHVLFMQENKYKEAIGFYEPIVKKHYDNVSSGRSEKRGIHTHLNMPHPSPNGT